MKAEPAAVAVSAPTRIWPGTALLRRLAAKLVMGSKAKYSLPLLEVPVEDEAWRRLDPSQRRQRTLDAVKRLLLRESQVQPLMLLGEEPETTNVERVPRA